MKFTMTTRRTAATIAALTLAGAGLTACSDSGNDTAASGSNGTAESSDVLATTSVWADVASAVTGNDVDSVIKGTDIDPHHFEPSAKDLARVREAGTLVANGGAYDASLYTVTEQDRIIHAVPLVSKEEAEAHMHAHEHGEEGHDHEHEGHEHGEEGHGEEGHEHEGHDHEHHNHEHEGHDHSHGEMDIDDLEHAWFSPAKVKEVADAVKEKVGGSTDDVDKRMAANEEKLAELPHTHIAMTETIAAPLVWGTELHDITPEGYMKAALNESEPSVQDVAEFIDEIKAGHVDVLIVNPQSTNSATEQLANAARESDVPVVEMRETPPEGVNFLDYFDQVVDELAETVKGLPDKGEDEHAHEEHAA